MNEEKYFKQFFDVWYESIKIMKEHKDNDETINEGIIFIKEE